MKKNLFVMLFLLLCVNPFLSSPALCQVRIMPLGDSITEGLGDPYEAGYRPMLWDLLKANGYEVNFVGSLNTGSLNGGFDADHEGHSGWTAYDIVGELKSWLNTYRPDIVLLHIGSNGLEAIPDGVSQILDEIFTYNSNTWVILSLIINRACCLSAQICPECQLTTVFNNNVQMMAQTRIDSRGEQIVIVDMESGAGIDYRIQPLGDMFDNEHPYTPGYRKMADVWFDALSTILPVIEKDNSGGGGGSATGGGSGGSNSGGGGGGSCFISATMK
jgi:lysophospholipase L1-like esterase